MLSAKTNEVVKKHSPDGSGKEILDFYVNCNENVSLTSRQFNLSRPTTRKLILILKNKQAKENAEQQAKKEMLLSKYRVKYYNKDKHDLLVKQKLHSAESFKEEELLSDKVASIGILDF